MPQGIEAVESLTTTVSSGMVDDLVYTILEADMDDTIEVPTRLPSNVNYGINLKNHYRVQDIAWVRDRLPEGLTPFELHTLDALACWTYRNTGDLVRSAIGLLGAALFDILPRNFPHDVEANEIGSDAYDTFIEESPWTIRRLLKTSTTVGAIDAKIPIRTHASVFEQLENIPAMDRVSPNIVERERQATLLTSVSSNSNLVESNMDLTDFAAARLIQMVKSVSEYKREEGFGRLRSFLTNGSMLATLVRIKTKNDTGMIRLSMDILDMIHAIDRLLNSNCVAANSLLQRMIRGELVYDEIIAMSRHQHRIMAVEFIGLTTLFAYFLKKIEEIHHDDSDIFKAVSRLIRFAGITEQYTNEIVAKQFNQR